MSKELIKADMENTFREKAMEWWNAMSHSEKGLYMEGEFKYRHPQSLTGREIQFIWAAAERSESTAKTENLIKAVPHGDGVLYVDEHCEIKVRNMMYDSKTHEVSRLNRGEMPYLWEYQIIAQSNLNIEGVPYAVIEHDKKAKLFSEEDMGLLWQRVVDCAKEMMLSGENRLGGYEDNIDKFRPKPIGYEVVMEEDPKKQLLSDPPKPCYIPSTFTDNDKQYIKLKPVYEHKSI